MAEGARLESVFRLTPNESSNLSLSAILQANSKFLYISLQIGHIGHFFSVLGVGTVSPPFLISIFLPACFPKKSAVDIVAVDAFAVPNVKIARNATEIAFIV